MPRRNRLYCDRRSRKYIPYLTVQAVSPRELNRIFNEHAYYERFQRGEFIACLNKETNASSLDEPPGTRSLTVWYMDREGNRICLVHFYLRPDLRIGGRPPFRPEPKVLIHDGTRYELA